MSVTIVEAKAETIRALIGLGHFRRVSARTVGFWDLARVSCIFVTIHGTVSGKPFSASDENTLRQMAIERGFRVQFR